MGKVYTRFQTKPAHPMGRHIPQYGSYMVVSPPPGGYTLFQVFKLWGWRKKMWVGNWNCLIFLIHRTWNNVFHNIGESEVIFVNANNAASKHNSAGFNERLQILNGDDLPPRQLRNESTPTCYSARATKNREFKGLFTWRWGTTGRWGNSLRWGNPEATATRTSQSNWLILAKQQLCTCIMLFCTFLWRQLHDYDENCLISRFIDNVNIRLRISPALFKLGYFS